MRFLVQAICDCGLVRKHNEDMILIDQDLVRDGVWEGSLELRPDTSLCLALADGMGGMSQGDLASQRVLEEIRRRLAKIPQDLEADELTEVLQTSGQEIHRSLPPASGSTLVGLLWYRQTFWCFHAGDSRLYLVENGKIQQLSKDHSLREQKADPSIPSNILVNSLGGGRTSFLEISPLATPKPGTSFLLSSDGLHDKVSQAEIEQGLADATNPAKALVQVAMHHGAPDNISVILAKILED